MKTQFKKSFLKSIKQIKNTKIREAVIHSIEEVEKSQSLPDIPNLKKLKGFREYYRIRIGDYRIGLMLDQDTLIFVAFEGRKDIYKKFP